MRTVNISATLKFGREVVPQYKTMVKRDRRRNIFSSTGRTEKKTKKMGGRKRKKL
jgi:hypothetical protein